MGRPRSPGRRAHIASLALLTCALVSTSLASSAAAGTWDLLSDSLVIPCPPGAIDVGAPGHERFLIAGFHGIERNERSFAWTGGPASVLVPLAEEGPRELRLTVHALATGQSLEARWNGTSLGRRVASPGWAELVWSVPATRAGYNRLDLLPSRVDPAPPPDPRRLAVAVDRLEAHPAPCPEEGTIPQPEQAAGVVLPARGVLLATTVMPPFARVHLVAQGSPGDRVRVFAWRGVKQRELGELILGAEGRATWELDTGDCCFGPGGVVALAGEGALELSLLQVAGDDSGWAWRRACRLPWLEAGLLLLLAGAVVGGRGWLGRRGLPWSGSPWAPWIDAALVTLLALAVRWWFLQLYPEPGRSADEYEYLLRSRRLASGNVSLLGDTSWHAWQTWTRPPGYYLFLAWIQGPLGGTVAAVIRFQAVLSALAAGATTLIGSSLFGRAAGLVTGLWMALYVESIVTFSRVLTEPLYMAFLVPGLAALTAVTVRPSWRIAALAGVLFGLAALVRSAPIYYVPLAALLLFAIHGRRAALRPALALVVGLLALVIPWSVRNSLIPGAPKGVDDLAVINLLQAWPNEEFVPYGDLDIASQEGYHAYYRRLQRANEDGALGRRGGELLRSTLVRLASQPVTTARRFAGQLGNYFAFEVDATFAHVHRETRRCRAAFATDLTNLQYLSLLVLAAIGLGMTWRDKRVWPLLLWFLFNTVLINLLFHLQPRFRFPSLPVLMVFVGVAVARLSSNPGPDRA